MQSGCIYAAFRGACWLVCNTAVVSGGVMAGCAIVVCSLPIATGDRASAGGGAPPSKSLHRGWGGVYGRVLCGANTPFPKKKNLKKRKNQF